MTTRLDELREQVDQSNIGWVAALGQRFEATREIGRLKASNGVDAVDPEREARQLERIGELAVEAGAPVDLSQQILRLIMDYVVEEHVQTAKNPDSAILESNN